MVQGETFIFALTLVILMEAYVFVEQINCKNDLRDYRKTLLLLITPIDAELRHVEIGFRIRGFYLQYWFKYVLHFCGIYIYNELHYRLKY